MDEIKVYFFTIFKVFLLLSSIFIIFTVIKYSRTKSKNKRNNSLSMRGSSKILKQTENENKDNSYKVLDKSLTNEKVYKYDNGDLYKGEFINGKSNWSKIPECGKDLLFRTGQIRDQIRSARDRGDGQRNRVWICSAGNPWGGGRQGGSAVKICDPHGNQGRWGCRRGE